MESEGGLSVSDLVQRHSRSDMPRPNLPSGRRAAHGAAPEDGVPPREPTHTTRADQLRQDPHQGYPERGQGRTRREPPPRHGGEGTRAVDRASLGGQQSARDPKSGPPRPPRGASKIINRRMEREQGASGSGSAMPPTPSRRGRRPAPPAPDIDPLSMTTEMEPIGEHIERRRKVDHTLARFSAVHDQLAEEERKRREKRKRLMPWRNDDDELDLAADASSASRPLPQPGNRPEPTDRPQTNGRQLALKVITTTAAVLMFIVTGVGWGAKVWVDNKFQQIQALDENSSAILNAELQAGDQNFLLVGSDTRAGATEADGVGSADNVKGARSDTLMIAHIPADRSRVVMVSFPRDLEITRPACEQWDSGTGEYSAKAAPSEKNAKLNSAYNIGGPRCVTKMIQELTGLRINHFIGIDFSGFKEMVDAVQGVQLCLERPVRDDELGLIVAETGPDVTLEGDQALSFVRARKVQGDPTSDYGRIQRQQRFLSALLRKAMSTQVLLDPGKLTDFISAFAKATFGENLGVDQMITFGTSLQGLETGQVTFVTVPTVGTANERGNEVLVEKDSTALFTSIINDRPLPGKDAKPGQPPSQGAARQQFVDPSTVKIQVLNGGNTKERIATKASEQLGNLGFDVVRVDNAQEKVPSTVVRYSAGKADAARTLATSVPGATLQEDPSIGGAVVLIIGPDFNGEIISPARGEAGAQNGARSAPAPQSAPASQSTGGAQKDLPTVNAADTSCS